MIRLVRRINIPRPYKDAKAQMAASRKTAVTIAVIALFGLVFVGIIFYLIARQHGGKYLDTAGSVARSGIDAYRDTQVAGLNAVAEALPMVTKAAMASANPLSALGG